MDPILHNCSKFFRKRSTSLNLEHLFLMILSVFEKASNNCVKSDPQFMTNRCEIDAGNRNGKKVGQWSENDSETGSEIDSKSEKGGKKGCGNRDRKSVRKKCGRSTKRIDTGGPRGRFWEAAGGRGERFISEFPDCTSVV